MVPLFDPEKRAELVRPKMMKDGRFLISRIEGTGQDPRVIDVYFRYYNYIGDDTAMGKKWLEVPPKERWSPKFLGLSPNFKSKELKEVKKLQYQNPAYSAAFRLKGKLGDPKDFNVAFASQLSGCTYACNFCYVPSQVNAANPALGMFFSPKEIIEHFERAREKSKEPINVLRITGGEPTIVPEIVLGVYDRLEEIPNTYLWIDTNLSTTKYLLKLEGDLKSIVKKRNVGVVGCFKGFCKDDFSIITGAKPEFYENQFEAAKLFLEWKTDFYVYLPSLIYEDDIESKARDFMEKLRELNKNLPLRVEMLDIREVGGALENIRQKEKEDPCPR